MCQAQWHFSVHLVLVTWGGEQLPSLSHASVTVLLALVCVKKATSVLLLLITCC